MKFEKSPQKLVDVFESIVPGAPAEKRAMFGYPCAFINGNMFMGLFGDQMHLRLAEGSRAELIAMGGRMFEPMPGRPMREYVVVPESMLVKRSVLAGWVKRAMAYGASIPPKKKPAKSKRKAR